MLSVAKIQEYLQEAVELFDQVTDQLKALLEKCKELQTVELMDAVLKSQHSYEEIIRFIKSDKSEEEA